MSFNLLDFFQGQKYSWTQKQCDDSFKKEMHRLCEDKYSGYLNNQKSSLFMNLGEIYKKIYNGWKKATENKSSKAEAKRLWREAYTLFKMITKWTFIFNDVKKCKHGADIYHHAVKSFGIYAYRQKSKAHCSEKCAETIGKP